ncbi:MAG: methyltransferase domain-containing protein [Luteitalea sp.]|nr:methyltransferase domain-containing protein [Luteitalea sp.]
MTVDAVTAGRRAVCQRPLYPSEKMTPPSTSTPARRPSLRDALSTPDRKQRYVSALFQRIAHRYDLITVLLSYGRDRRWKAELVDLANVRPGERAVDLACGTGDLAYGLAARGARVAGLDFAPEMTRLARSKARRSPLDPSTALRVDGERSRTVDSRRSLGASSVTFVVGDMLKLPLPDASVTLVTAGYGLRNAAVLDTALAEIYRVLAPGGRMLALDFNQPANAVVRAVYLAYLTIVGSVVGLALHRDADTYRYIPASLARYPGAADVAARMAALGFVDTEWRPLLGGLMAINMGRKAP